MGQSVDCKGREGKGNKDSLFAWSKSILAVNAVFGKYPNATLVRSKVISCLDCFRDHPLHVFQVGIGLRTSRGLQVATAFLDGKLPSTEAQLISEDVFLVCTKKSVM